MECSVCCEKFSARKTCTQCEWCGYTACVQCVKKIILDSSDSGKCANCRKMYSILWLYDNMPQTWLKVQYRQHRKHSIHNLEKFTESHMDILEKRKAILDSERKILKLKSKLIDRSRPEIEEEIYTLEKKIQEWRTQNNIEQTLNQTKITMKCSRTHCIGYFVLTDERILECFTCNNRLCSMCRELPHEGACSQDTLASVKMIESISTKCPKCGVACERKDGCSQVSCLMCHTTFNHSTGTIDKGHAHNPDYLDWVKSDKMKQADIDTYNDGICGELLPNEDYLINLIYDSNHNAKNLTHFIDELESCYTTMKKVEDKMIPALKRMIQQKAQNTKIMADPHNFKKTDDRSKKRLHTQYFRAVSEAEYGEVMLPYVETFYFAGRDILRKMIKNPKLEDCQKYLTELVTLREMQIVTKMNQVCGIVLGYCAN